MQVFLWRVFGAAKKKKKERRKSYFEKQRAFGPLWVEALTTTIFQA